MHTCDSCGFEGYYEDEFDYFPQSGIYQCAICTELDDREARDQKVVLSEVTDYLGFFWEEDF